MSSLVPPVSAVSDVLALHRLDGWLTPPVRTVVGVAEPRLATVRTVRIEIADRGPGLTALYDVLGDDLTGVALVLSSAHELAGAVWGEILSRAARLAGASVVVVDGLARDPEAMAHEGLPVYALGLGVVGPNGTAHAVEVDVPVTVGGVSVEPGDAIVADAAGVVRVPAGHVDRVIDDASAYAKAEEALLEALAEGRPLSTAYRIKRHAVETITGRGPGSGSASGSPSRSDGQTTVDHRTTTQG